jgi:prepilin-type N-terminal cleavage/methylation domain-containing protein/prepilin-type processing-associated H-X9-DG protein
MMTRLASRPPWHGFTLIELLVVIAVISILSTLLMPSVLRAMRMATTANCKSNIRQIGHGFQMYRPNYDLRTFPWGQARWPGDTAYGDNPANSTRYYGWPMPSMCLERWVVDRHSEVWVCPADRPARKRGPDNWWLASYTFNGYLDYVADIEIKHPARVIPFCCGFWDGGWFELPGCRGGNHDDSPYTTNRADYKRHGGKFTATYYDGHVEMLYPLDTSRDDFYPF